jgi:hypothetical protein
MSEGWGHSRVFFSQSWQMTYGERAALEGLVSAARPEVALEIGMAQGGSLDCIAAHSGEVHSFDLVPPEGELSPNVTAHTGNSRETVPRVLGELAAAGRTVEFALIDGDHTAAGVRADLETVVGSEAVDFALVVLHDTMNEEVRRGIMAAGLERTPRVVYANLDLVPGFLARSGPFEGQLWGGLGLVVVDSGGQPWREGVFEDGHADPHGLMAAGARSPRALARRMRQRVVDRTESRRAR